jgi:hypothetical protein
LSRRFEQIGFRRTQIPSGKEQPLQPLQPPLLIHVVSMPKEMRIPPETLVAIDSALRHSGQIPNFDSGS